MVSSRRNAVARQAKAIKKAKRFEEAKKERQFIKEGNESKLSKNFGKFYDLTEAEHLPNASFRGNALLLRKEAKNLFELLEQAKAKGAMSKDYYNLMRTIINNQLKSTADQLKNLKKREKEFYEKFEKQGYSKEDVDFLLEKIKNDQRDYILREFNESKKLLKEKIKEEE